MIIFTNIKAVAALQFFFSVSSLSFSLSKLLHILLQNDSMRVDNPQIFYLNKIGGKKKSRATTASAETVCIVFVFPNDMFCCSAISENRFLFESIQ